MAGKGSKMSKMGKAKMPGMKGKEMYPNMAKQGKELRKMAKKGK